MACKELYKSGLKLFVCQYLASDVLVIIVKVAFQGKNWPLDIRKLLCSKAKTINDDKYLHHRSNLITGKYLSNIKHCAYCSMFGLASDKEVLVLTYQ